jgi:hypothetical protein
MDTGTVNDRTVAWQAEVMYQRLYESTPLDEDLQDLQAAFSGWQSQRMEFYAHEWDWLLEEAKEKQEAAFDALVKLPKRITSAGLKRRRERWESARAKMKELETDYREAERQIQSARDNYVSLLDTFR